MAEQIISGSGVQYALIVNADGSINTSNIVIPTSVYNPAYTFTYITSGTATGVTGSSIGSIAQQIGATTYNLRLTYQSGLMTGVGSWV